MWVPVGAQNPTEGAYDARWSATANATGIVGAMIAQAPRDAPYREATEAFMSVGTNGCFIEFSTVGAVDCNALGYSSGIELLAQIDQRVQLIETLVWELTIADYERCLTDGDLESCLWTLVDLIPGAGGVDAVNDARRVAEGIDDSRRSGDTMEDVVDAARAAVCSFDGRTEILLADGTTKEIADIEVGDWVWAADPETGEAGPRQVAAVWVHEDTILDLEIEGGGEVATTEDHPFWNATDSDWQRADALDPGDRLLSTYGDLLTVVGLDLGSTRTTTAYNLSVDGVHTYFVVANIEPVLVHNSCFPTPSRVVNSNMTHAAPRAVERAGFATIQDARAALQELSSSIRQSGFPTGTIADTARADRVLVPFGDGGYAVYQLRPNGTAALRTVLQAR